ncbi:hypothetical protein E2C01_035573 [Portunus trituberculatus]|uniref:Uncharacterized protein n=1 Tax=Portunus trituberculatus TaxID=210409 RepID=A0A5B7F679_PORTR|nr:hypothetical protein [Portunus trituberculatus]
MLSPLNYTKEMDCQTHAKLERDSPGMSTVHPQSSCTTEVINAVEVCGRVLPPPTLLASHRVVPEGGRWRLGQGVGLYKPATLHTWSLVQYDVQGLKRNNLHERFLQQLKDVGRTLGMEVRQPSVDVVRKVTKPLDDLVALLRYYPYSQLTLFLMRPGVQYLHGGSL